MHQWEAATQVWEMALRYDLWRRHPLGTQFQLESVGDGGQHPTLRGLSTWYNHVKHSVCKWNASLHQLRLKFEWQGVCAVRLGTASLVESQMEKEPSNFIKFPSCCISYISLPDSPPSFFILWKNPLISSPQRMHQLLWMRDDRKIPAGFSKAVTAEAPLKM